MKKREEKWKIEIKNIVQSGQAKKKGSCDMEYKKGKVRNSVSDLEM